MNRTLFTALSGDAYDLRVIRRYHLHPGGESELRIILVLMECEAMRMSCNRPKIPQLRVSNTRLAQAASGCAPSAEVLPISDVKQKRSAATPLEQFIVKSLSSVSSQKSDLNEILRSIFLPSLSQMHKNKKFNEQQYCAMTL
ncbi:hypothetical protein WN51_07563 [Melipona quadrifasciata]|uniref:Uncharacterized protein n=1 Tax=Melipona quadrifasciata TaxID=166423 RepID=A0A0N0U6S3_9HYME|nr:hypothetical protein WN51_07563 [Melipona quadrifasciata]